MHSEPLLRLSHRVDGGVAVVRLSGEVDVYTAPLLRDYLVELVDAGHCHLVMDLAELVFLDSSGLAVLAGAWRRIRQGSGTLALAEASPRLQNILHLTRLDLAFRVFGTVTEAVDAGRPGPPGTGGGSP